MHNCMKTIDSIVSLRRFVRLHNGGDYKSYSLRELIECLKYHCEFAMEINPIKRNIDVVDYCVLIKTSSLQRDVLDCVIERLLVSRKIRCLKEITKLRLPSFATINNIKTTDLHLLLIKFIDKVIKKDYADINWDKYDEYKNSIFGGNFVIQMDCKRRNG